MFKIKNTNIFFYYSLIFLVGVIIYLKYRRLFEERNLTTGKALFIKHCGTCHLPPDPSSLPKEVWKNSVLPKMASRLGIIYEGFDPYKGKTDEEKNIQKLHRIIPDKAVINEADWEKLVSYINVNAPNEIIFDKQRLTRNKPLKQFVRRDIPLGDKLPSLICSLKYDHETKTVWIGNVYNKILNWKWDKGVTRTLNVSGPVVNFNFYNSETFITEVGILSPTDLNLGSYAIVESSGDNLLLDSLHRPVHSEMDDLNDDGIPEIVVCNFGEYIGSLSLYVKNSSNNQYIEHVLLAMPGAIKTIIYDMDKDGKKDIVALFAQGDERVYIFYQRTGLQFETRSVLRFPPHYGTTDMQMIDYNGDGQMDIVTAHGDNADFSNILKPFHGIRLHINMGNDKFKETFFYPVYGACKVIAEDFDKDGDIDFAVTSFFPDYRRLKNESFQYLENINKSLYSFESYTQNNVLPLKTLCMDKGDIDGDGDIDIIFGNFSISPFPSSPDLEIGWRTAKYGLILFQNELYSNRN